ncbi:MAG: SGNH/GDSL hydrolase family protein [Verrucomicrobiota bacterium]|jgi:lysophospholipase L1-like esterase
MKIKSLAILLGLSVCFTVFGEQTETTPNDPYFAGFYLPKAPKPKGTVLRAGDQLAICGDSITEQKMYSRIIETYLTVAVPELHIGARQFGWSGEQASGFLQRMTNDVLRFHPTVATTCYGMNDHHYRPYEPAIGQAYASNMTDIVLAFESAGTRVVIGSPGCMGFTKAPWGNFFQGTPEDRNLNLCMLRDIDIQIAQVEHTGFADVFLDMFQAQYFARKWYGTNFGLAGKDSVHPGWAGHLVMAYAFLKGLDVPGDIGTFTVDLGAKKAAVSQGHQLLSFQDGAVTIKSGRYPFCATGQADKDDSIRAGMTLVPFNAELNRLMLIVKGGKANNYQVTWGDTSRSYSAQQLAQGVNLAADFEVNPFSNAFAAVDLAVAKKQDYETIQVKNLFHGDEGKANMEKTVADSEVVRQTLADAIVGAFVPVTHTIVITAQ